MQLVNIGFGNLVSLQRLIAIVSPDSAPVKRLVQESRDRGMLIDATYGRKTASVLIMDSDHAEYVGNFYGTPKRYVDDAMAEGKDVILDIEVQGAAQVHELRPEVVRIFVAPPSWEELERRLKARGTDSPEKIQERLLRAKVELESADSYDYFVINDTVESAVKELRAIMLAEHCRPADRIGMLR